MRERGNPIKVPVSILVVYLIAFGCIDDNGPGPPKGIDQLSSDLDTLLLGTWSGGLMYVVDDWPQVTDTLESIIPIDGWTVLVLGKDSSFTATPGGYYTAGPLEFGEGTWKSVEGQIILAYSTWKDTFDYQAADPKMNLIRYYPDGNEYYQGKHWLVSPFSRWDI